MRFDINDYPGRCVMHCDTEEKAAVFCKYLHSLGRTWGSKDSYEKDSKFSCYKSNTAYYFNDNSFCYLDYFLRKNYIILNFDDFDWNDDYIDDVSDDDVLNFIGGSYDI